ncbi:MerR family transcriptional regulator [Defluviitalea raffinosedens]|mgnify:CR=1 FL=1|jgi:DNA-binding transcriptional MerR regulator|uniref:MerR family transcriptional regulator n=1 Tax=Defluviitalea raffinosedens TaxID=1450156 RepID=A0A7C8LEM0_9FIRM|nr:MerR family transcriptional regulator [Defluviitalea raffinosedens]KAE9634120.1 MerR family transcriptional regulator [Defluviitalea raffinosedens]MBM7685990.1 DNA-binding transcriptional MerR regulator [Defluviitalea raffinosedens]HHW68068.1 MerR family transcriptional regulator [Candidatus Epulonipiscium sp.]
MKTVKQISDLTGVSIRMLHHYDKIGLLKPTQLTESGYRLYDDQALATLQQILFFKELDFKLNEIKEIINSPNFDRMKVLENQKKLITLKRDRLNSLIELINKILEGDQVMSFKEFDMSAYYRALDEFKRENYEKVIKMFGSEEKYDEMIAKAKEAEKDIAQMAIKQYGSIENYVEAMKKNLNNEILANSAKQIDDFKNDFLYDQHPKLKELFKVLTEDLSKDISSEEIQKTCEEITHIVKEDYEVFKTNMGDSYWYSMVKQFLVLPEWVKEVDEKYGSGASKFIGKALEFNLKSSEPKLEILYKKLTSDLNKSPVCDEVQKMISEIVDETEKQNEYLRVEMGENYWTYLAEQYCSNPVFIESMDKNYGKGASKLIGEALMFYIENNKMLKK